MFNSSLYQAFSPSNVSCLQYSSKQLNIVGLLISGIGKLNTENGSGRKLNDSPVSKDTISET